MEDFRDKGLALRSAAASGWGDWGIRLNWPVEQDHYAVLGVEPAAEQGAIRAAYRTLMRRYHPDADASEEAAGHARAINHAYSVLGDPEKRARYDGLVASTRPLRFEPSGIERPREGRTVSISRYLAVLVGLLAVGMITFAIMPPTEPLPFGGSVPEGRMIQRPKRAAASVEGTAAGQPTKAVVAAAASPAVRAVDVPQPASEVVDVGATAERSAVPQLPPIKIAKVPLAQPAVVELASSPKPAVVHPAPVDPRCSSASQRADQLVCGDRNLASLDRQLTLLYRQSWSKADEGKRAALLGSRQGFNDRREACESSNCLTTTYVGRLKEISDIMAGRTQP